MTKWELSKKANVSVSFISDLTNGQGNPSLKIMNRIADALETPLPTLLVSTDFDRESLNALMGNKAVQKLPEGFELVSAVVPSHRAYIIKKWDEETRTKLRNLV